jgi:hypothetical protein
MTTKQIKTMRVAGLLIVIALYMIMIPVALATVLVWYSITWPWYLWRGIRTAMWPRPFRV